VLNSLATIRCRDTTFQNIQAVIFDKDGTLANSETFLRNLAQRRSRLVDAQVPGVEAPLLMAFGVDNNQFNPAGLMAIGTRQENEIAAAAYVAETGQDWTEALRIARSAFAEADKYMQRKADHTPLVEGALDLLKTMAEAGLKLGILSADRTNHVIEFVETYQLSPYIQFQTGVDDRLSKSDPSLLQRCFAALGAPPEQTLVVGDSQIDIQIARAFSTAGCIAFSGGWTSRVQLAKADCVINRLDEIQVNS
jgi:phosphoglycolate phosphatase